MDDGAQQEHSDRSEQKSSRWSQTTSQQKESPEQREDKDDLAGWVIAEDSGQQRMNRCVVTPVAQVGSE